MVTVPAESRATPARKMDPVTMVLFIVVCVLFVALMVRGRLEHNADSQPAHTHPHAAVSGASVISQPR